MDILRRDTGKRSVKAARPPSSVSSGKVKHSYLVSEFTNFQTLNAHHPLTQKKGLRFRNPFWLKHSSSTQHSGVELPVPHSTTQNGPSSQLHHAALPVISGDRAAFRNVPLWREGRSSEGLTFAGLRPVLHLGPRDTPGNKKEETRCPKTLPAFCLQGRVISSGCSSLIGHLGLIKVILYSLASYNAPVRLRRASKKPVSMSAWPALASHPSVLVAWTSSPSRLSCGSIETWVELPIGEYQKKQTSRYTKLTTPTKTSLVMSCRLITTTISFHHLA